MRQQAAQLRRVASRIGFGRLAIVAVLLLAAILIARFAWHAPLAIDAERAMYDIRFLIAAPRVDQDPRIVMVVYTDDTLARTGRRSPLDRALLASALSRIDKLGPKSIGIDILIDQPEPEDHLLIDAMRRMKTPTWLAFATNATNQDAVLPWQEDFQRRFEARLAPGNVHPTSIRLQADTDGVMRRWPNRPPGLPPLLVDDMADGAGPFATYQRSIAYRLPRTVDRPVFTSLPIDLFDSDAGAEALRSQIAGRYVLLGGDISDVDRFATPSTRLANKKDPQNPFQVTTAGLEIHANMLAQRLDERIPAVISGATLWLMALIVALAGAAAGVSEFNGWRLALLLGVGVAVIVLLPLGMQKAGIDTGGLPAFGWLIGWTLAYSAAAATARGMGSEQRRFAQGALGRYLPRDIATAILLDPEKLSLHGERTTIFALFSDLEGFTKLTHAIAPEMVATLLNRYLDTLSAIVLAHGGTIDKFVGDAVVAFWGAPIARPDDGDRALGAAIAIVAAGETFRSSAPTGVPPIGRTRVGVHRGEAIVGNFGGEGRIQYTALGDAMNTASRLEGANKALGTRALVSADAALGMTDPPLRRMGCITVRGRATPLDVLEPVPEIARSEIEDHDRMLRNFDSGAPDAIKALERYAMTRHDDKALGKLVYNLAKIGPGGCLALD